MNNDTARFAEVNIGKPIKIAEIPLLGEGDFRLGILAGVEKGWRIASLFGTAAPSGAVPFTAAPSSPVGVYAIMADDEQNLIHVTRCEIGGASFKSIAALCPQAQLFEREIAEQFGIIPDGHPWMKPVRYHHSWTERDAWGRAKDLPIEPAVGDFFRIEGEQVHEVAVGPVHAGVIEPGHFRFQCHGEQVFHLEIALGFQHRDIERSLIGGPDKRTLHFAETLSGDSTVAHATSYCQIIEALSGIRPSAHDLIIRGIALELERLASHVGDLGALAGDVGFLPTSSFCGRIRGDFLNMTALLSGNRFGRGLIVPGGIGFDLECDRRKELLKRLAISEKETGDAINLLWKNQAVMARFEDTGPLTREAAIELGIVGPAARASGLARDVRYNQPSGIYRFAQIPVSTCETGDVFARAYVRWLEIQQSICFIREQVAALNSGVHNPHESRASEFSEGTLAGDSLAVSLNEGWRGENCHVALTDSRGFFSRYKVVDPSFHNWSGLAMVLRNQEISDFPICNKSFNLSYCGHDL